MKEKRAIALSLFLTACGARTGLDVPDADTSLDATVDVYDASKDVAHDAPPDVVILPDASVQCANGYFIEVSDDDGGTTLIDGGCHASLVPAHDCVPNGEDCITTAIDGCSVTSIVLAYEGCSCGALSVSNKNGHTLFTNANGQWFGQNTIDVTSLGSTAAIGTYDTTIISSDGGAKAHLHGAFCVRP